MDDRAVGLVLRALRRRRGLRQSDLAARARCSQALVSSIERGHLARSTVESIRSLFEALDARLQLAPRWRGAELDRLIDADHGLVVAAGARRVEREDDWRAEVEVTYAEAREHGSIDVLGINPRARAVLVGEIKTDIPSSEAVVRKLDEKARLAPRIVLRRHGWTPVVVARVLILPESPRLRRLVDASPILRRMFPIASRAVAAWLRDPGGELAATWFLSGIALGNPRRVRTASRSARDAAGAQQPAGPRSAKPLDGPPPSILRAWPGR